MAKAQFPIDGKLGKAWKVTSTMGWRIHPVSKVKKHHNGTDIWAKAEPTWIEAPYDGKVINVGNNPSGFGNSVTLLHKIDGKQYVTLYAHMANGSIKVKKGQKIQAGTPLGKMGSTGISTGKHLHWELQKGKSLVWSANGKNYIEPVAFFKAVIAKEKAVASAPVVTPADAPVAPEPTHDDKGAAAIVKAEKAAPKAEVKPAFIRPVNAGISDNFAAHKARKSVNPGTDYVVGIGVPVVAVADGVVSGTTTTIKGAGGRMVWLDCANGYNFDYLHLSRVDVSPGQTVKQGQVLGLSGASGLGKERGYGPHLHLSARVGGKHVNGAGNFDYEAFLAGQGGNASAPAAPAAPAASGGRKTVKKGSKGADVKHLQSRLGITADGDFGPKTHAAVTAFQTSKGLVADGIVGPKTWAAIG
jgi:murein DD-endopeptidase MepM/ murein hydrolase activator NlpD